MLTHARRDRIEALFEPAAADLPAVHGSVAGAGRARAAQLDRIDVESPGEHVEQLLLGERRLRPAESPEAFRGRVVGVDELAVHLGRGESVEIVHANARRHHDRRPVRGVRAVVGPQPRLLGDQLAGRGGAEPHVDAHRDAGPPADHVVAARHHHRRVALQAVGERQAHEMRGMLPLRAERAADVGADDVELSTPVLDDGPVLIGQHAREVAARHQLEAGSVDPH